MSTPTASLFWLFSALAVASSASAHTRIKPGGTLIVRSTSSGEKTGPCGAYPPTTDPAQRTTLKPGQQLTVMWEETIQHISHFRIAFSPDGATGFDTNVIMDNIPDNQNGATTYTDPTTYHQFSQVIKVPTTLCETCALQVIQVMLDNPATPSNYYSCADIRISNNPAPVVTPSPGNATGTTAMGTGTGISTGTAASAGTAAGQIATAPASGTLPAAAPVPAPPAPTATALPPQNLKVTITP